MKRFLFTVLCAGLSALSVAPLSASPYTDALTLAQKGQYSQSATAMKKALQSAPNNRQYQSFYIALLAASGNQAEALLVGKNFLKASFSPAVADVYVPIAKATGEDVLTFFGVLRNRFSKSPVVLNYGFNLALKENKPEEAKKYLAALKKLSPGYNAALIEDSSMISLAQDSPDEALKTLSTLSGADKQSAKALSLTAQSYNNKGLHQKAIDTLNTAVKLYPKQASFEISLGSNYLHIGYYKEAMQSINKALGIDPKSLTARLMKAQIEETTGNFKAALQSYKAVLDTGVTPRSRLVNLAFVYAQQGQPKEADKLLRQVVSQRSYSPFLLFAVFLTTEQVSGAAAAEVMLTSHVKTIGLQSRYKMLYDLYVNKRVEAISHAIKSAPAENLFQRRVLYYVGAYMLTHNREKIGMSLMTALSPFTDSFEFSSARAYSGKKPPRGLTDITVAP